MTNKSKDKRWRLLSIFVMIVLVSEFCFSQSATQLTYDANGNRLAKKTQGSSIHPELSATLMAVNLNQPTTLTATGCPATVRWSTGQEGATVTVFPQQTTEYTAECITADCKVNGSEKITIDVIDCAKSPLSIDVSAIYVKYGQPVTMTATGCKNGTVQWSTGELGDKAVIKIYGPSNVITATCRKTYCPDAGSGSATIVAVSDCAPGDVMATVKAGNWNDPTTWRCGRIPTIDDEVFLGHVVTLTANADVRKVVLGTGNIVVQNNAILTYPNSNQ